MLFSPASVDKPEYFAFFLLSVKECRNQLQKQSYSTLKITVNEQLSKLCYNHLPGFWATKNNNYVNFYGKNLTVSRKTCTLYSIYVLHSQRLEISCL